VKFGYYGSEDIKALLRPLIAVLDCKHDKPFPPESDKGTELIVTARYCDAVVISQLFRGNNIRNVDVF